MNSSELSQQLHEDKKNVGINALLMAIGTMTSRVLGLLRDMAFAALFSRTVTDAWTTAFRLPNLFRRLLGEGSLSVSFIPVFVEARFQEGQGGQHDRSQNLVNSFYTLLLLILSTLTVLGIIFAEPILTFLLDANYSAIPGKFELTVRMARIMFVFIFLMSTYAYFMGILNALGKYALAAMAPALFNVAMILSTFVPTEILPSEGDAIAWGVVVGGFLQTVVLVPALRRHGFLPKLSLNLRAAFGNADARRVFINMLPGLLGTGLLQVTTIINLKFASSLGEGAISYIYWADRLLELPLSLVSVSLGTALLPTLSKMWSASDKNKMSETANYYLRLNLFVSIPAAIGLYVLAQPIVEVLFMRGRFNAFDAEQTALVVRVYALLLISSSCVRVLVPNFYAIKNTWLPAVVSGICLIVHIAIAPWLMKNYGLIGLSSSTMISATLNFLMLFSAYYFLIGSFGLRRLLRSLGFFVLAAGGLWLVTLLYGPLLQFMGNNFFGKVVSLGLVIAGGMGVYLAMSYYFQLEELHSTLDTVVAKVKRKLRK